MTIASRLRVLPVRSRLVAAFITVMLVVLAAAGAFVFWRVQVALDGTLNAELSDDARTILASWRREPDPDAAVTALGPEAIGQVLDPAGRLLAQSAAAKGLTPLSAAELRGARTTVVSVTGGNVLTGGKHRLRVRSLALPAEAGHQPDVAVVAIRLGQRDEALRELLAQLAAANLLALAAASAVGFRLARAALAPVERYRTRAQQITDGASGLRLDVADDIDDEISRLGHTLNLMLTAQEQAAAQQRQFLADASHELRSPLTVLSSEVELALRRPRSVLEYQGALEQVAQDIARLVALADQLLDVDDASRQAPLPGAASDALAAAERAASRARARCADPLRRVVVATPDASIREHPLLVPLTGMEMDQVLGNLADNAIVHGSGDVTITVTAAPLMTAARSSQDIVVITVSDQGAGPPAEFVAHANERFRRADASRATPGNGLGLALAHALVSRAGGELRLCAGRAHHAYAPAVLQAVSCSHPSDGTHVAVLLPRVTDA